MNLLWVSQRWFWLALIAGPLVWVGLLLIGVPKQPGWPSLRVLFFIVLVSPVLEEFVFRGGLQAWLHEQPKLRRKSVLNLSYANLITSVIFAGFHAFTQPIVWAVSVIAPSLVFGWARDKSGSVLPGMALHAWYNLGFVLLFVRG